MNSSLTLTSVLALLVVGICAAFDAFADGATLKEVGQERVEAGGSQEASGAPHQHHAASRFVPSKPLSVIHFVKPERYLASSGDTVTVHLTLMVSVPVEAVRVIARAQEGAVVSVSQQDLGAFAASEERKVSFDVTVLAEGRHYINVLATTETPDGVRQSSYSIPIEAGNVHQTAKSLNHTVVDDQGNRLLLMPAKTTTGDETPR